MAIHDTAQRTRIALKDTAAITQEKAKHTIRQLKITAAFAFDTALQWLPHVSIGRGAVTAALIGSTTILASSQRPYTGEILSAASPAIVIPATDHSQDLGVSLMAQFPEQTPLKQPITPAQDFLFSEHQLSDEAISNRVQAWIVNLPENLNLGTYEINRRKTDQPGQYEISKTRIDKQWILTYVAPILIKYLQYCLHNKESILDPKTQILVKNAQKFAPTSIPQSNWELLLAFGFLDINNLYPSVNAWTHADTPGLIAVNPNKNTVPSVQISDKTLQTALVLTGQIIKEGAWIELTHLIFSQMGLHIPISGNLTPKQKNQVHSALRVPGTVPTGEAMTVATEIAYWEFVRSHPEAFTPSPTLQDEIRLYASQVINYFQSWISSRKRLEEINSYMYPP